MPRSVKVLLFGSGRLGILALRLLREAGHDLIACRTHAPTEPASPSFAAACAAHGVPCAVEDDAGRAGNEVGHAVGNDLETSVVPFYAARPEMFVAAGFSRRIDPAWLALPTRCALAVHPAPLPRYRGQFAVEWGLIRGEGSWEVNVHQIAADGNEGPILRRRPVFVRPADNAYDLWMRSIESAGPALVETVDGLAAGSLQTTSPEVTPAAGFGPGLPFGGRIDWTRPASEIEAFVRAMDFGRYNDCGTYTPLRPPARAVIGGQVLGIWRASAGGTRSDFPPGTLTRCDDQVWVQTGRGHLALHHVRDALGRDHDAARLFAGLPFSAGFSFDAGPAWYDSSRLTQAA